jgi:PAS domain S-box-containing protein
MTKTDEHFNYDVLSALSSHIAVIDKTGTIIAVNNTWDEFANLNGTKNLKLTSIGSNYFSACKKAIISEDTIAVQTMKGINDVFEQKTKVFELEYPCNTPKEKKWYMLSVMLFGQDKSKVVVSHQDITIRKENEDSLKASEIRYRRIFEAAKDGIIILNEATGGIIDVNPFLVNLLGYSFDELLGKQLWEIGLFEDVNESKKAFEELKKNKYIRYEDMPLKTKNGEIRFVEFVSNVYDENNKKVIQCNVRDITEKVNTNNQLKENEQKLRSLNTLLLEETARLNEAQSIAKIGNWELVISDLSITWSREVYRIFEVYQETFVPSIEMFFIHLHPDDIKKVNNAFKESYINQKPNSVEHRVINKKKETKYILEIWNVITDEKGIPVRAIGTCQDITERKKLENETFEMIRQLQIKNNDLNQFAYIVSHNLRSHIAKIQGLMFLVEKDIDNKANNPELLKIILNEVNGLDIVIRDLNEILTIQDSGNKPMELVVFDTILKQVEQSLSVQIEESNALIKSNFSNSPKLITIKSYCYSIIHNLLSNAIKYRSPNIQLQIIISTNNDGSFVCLSFKDNGMGIDLIKHRNKIFGLYKRFHGNQIPGRGIGLNLIKIQIESLGGSVDVQSTVDVGTEFKIFFPIVKSN